MERQQVKAISRSRDQANGKVRQGRKTKTQQAGAAPEGANTLRRQVLPQSPGAALQSGPQRGDGPGSGRLTRCCRARAAAVWASTAAASRAAVARALQADEAVQQALLHLLHRRAQPRLHALVGLQHLQARKAVAEEGVICRLPSGLGNE